ncbi:SulP family inorganic anion transporter [Paracoccus denitrificans]|jgi:SulP family sulfate permease|uniref:Sulphate transporter n=1 Tax=Paracoccus denitrificans (strain Pd 1222) TaxID=318586 RepID=A1B5A5_PARDP|nr:SulP family inorganic anion transporter [Paracoccus denitrificans]ABL70699.1 sulphate transporter [Paracoccus denitrificans PD1222]MBB4627586.1 SulP family sulfate permease [Paracoccus denitrificans]MCU7429553.1 SulP family inorganic anion transporter [Paracoccus denitrificans]QAR26021.1 STAS domain-containing protein [Paracoccus denitrificans]UPV94933.1 SulP family inorganic anion transporter [Paracoccus denitrificans]
MNQQAIAAPGFAPLFTPKLITVLREGYGAAQLRADALAGLTVAIVALPLSMAIAIASGASPAQGLYTAIIGGFLVSALGGSRYQIGGPAGAFIVLVAGIVAQHGMSGLILATFMSGLMLVAIGFLRLGTFIKFIPFPVTVGFTAGIAVIIFTSQLKEIFGLTLAHEPGELVEKIPALWQARASLSPAALGIALGTVAVILGLKRARPHWPGMLIAVALAAGFTAATGADVATIGSRFGGIPSTLPAPSLPEFSLDRAMTLLPAAVSLTLLGAIESLLSAVVADGMTGRRHRSNCELVAQGVANMGSALFGGICVTGTIARTATNVRAGAHGPVAGMLHALFLLGFMLLAAPLASYIPLAALAGVLAVVAWNMIEKPAIAILLRSGWGEAAVLLVTFGLTIFRDLTEAIVTGLALGSVLFIQRMSQAVGVEALVGTDMADSAQPRPDQPHPRDVVVYRISGALFFGATASIGSVLDRIQDGFRVLVVDFSAVPFLDSTGANMIEGLAHKAQRRGIALWATGTSRDIRRVLLTHGLRRPLMHYAPTVEDALRRRHGS